MPDLFLLFSEKQKESLKFSFLLLSYTLLFWESFSWCGCILSLLHVMCCLFLPLAPKEEGMLTAFSLHGLPSQSGPRPPPPVSLCALFLSLFPRGWCCFMVTSFRARCRIAVLPLAFSFSEVLTNAGIFVFFLFFFSTASATRLVFSCVGGLRPWGGDDFLYISYIGHSSCHLNNF